MRTKRMARRAPAKEIAARVEEAKGTNSSGSLSVGEELEDLSKVIIPYSSSQYTNTSQKLVEVKTSSKDVLTGVKDRDDLLRWVCESFLRAYVQRSEEDEQDNSTLGSKEKQAEGENSPEEETAPVDVDKILESPESSSEETSSRREEEAATILSKVLGDIHRHTEIPVDTGHVVSLVGTPSATSDSSHSSNDIPLQDRLSMIAEERKAMSRKIS